MKIGIQLLVFMPMRKIHTKFEAISTKDVKEVASKADTDALLQISDVC